MSDGRQTISTGSHFEEAVGYARAVRVGDFISLSGTVGMDYATRTMSPDPVEQVRQIVRTMRWALGEAGSSLADVIQLTVYVTDPDVMTAITPELKAAFGAIRPTNTALVVAFPFPDIKVEISAIAIRGSGGPAGSS
jgi:enamine deaminase RidA (YjgF/YER057c/UK114 family)